VTTPSHPEDVEAEREATTYAKEQGSAFCEKYRAEIDALITTYADEDARDLLEALRERFYLKEW
jgi:hypothetical protein